MSDQTRPPGRSDGELLLLAHRRMAELRYRRRIVSTGAMAAVVLVVGALAIVRLDPGDGKVVRSTAADGVTAIPPPTTGLVGTTQPSMTTPGSTLVPSSTIARATTTTSPAVAPTSSTRPEVTTTTEVPARPCLQTQVTLGAAASDKLSYRPREAVTVSAPLTNSSPTSCVYASGNGISVRDAAGNEVYSSFVVASSSGDAALLPGAQQTVRWTWDQTVQASNQAAPPGRYSAVLLADGITSAPVAFSLVAS